MIWGQEALGLPIHDNWWQTETGGIMIANYACMDIRPGSMGRPLPGIEAAVLARDEDGTVVVDADGTAVEAAAGKEGELALRPGWPSMFRGYLGDQERYQKCFVGGWYLSGDLARRDEDGYFWFVGRGDDVIKSAGHLIGPFEVESALMEHPAVAEAGVIGIPDPLLGEVVKAFVTLNAGLRAQRGPAPGADRLRAQAARRRGGAEGDRVRPAPSAHQERQDHAARCSRPANSDCPRATRRRWRFEPMTDAASTRRRAPDRDRRSGDTRPPPPRRCCASAASRSAASSSTVAAEIRGFLHLGIGEEAARSGSWRRCRRRRRGRHLPRARPRARAGPLHARRSMAELEGKIEGCSRGRGGSMHLFDAATRFYGGNAIVGGRPAARGRAWPSPTSSQGASG